MTPLLAAILGYLAVQLGIGVWASRRVHTEDDYLVAGRRLGYPLAVLSIFATWFGAETCIGAAGEIYREGISFTSAEPFGYGLCLIFMGLVFAVPLWRRKLTTLPDLFRQQFSVPVERLAALILIPGSILWAAAQVRAFGHVLSSASSLDVDFAITAAAAFVILYTAVGGLLADAVTDLVQGILLVLGLLIVGIAAVAHLGGVQDAAAAVANGLGSGIPHGATRASLLDTVEAWAIPVCGSVVAVELVGRVIAARTPEIASRSSVVAGVMYVAVGLIPVFVGLTGAAIVPDLADAEQLLPMVAQTLLPAVLYALFAGALISAILSTVDSTLLVGSGLLSHNLIVPLLRYPTERQRVLIARLGVGGFGILAYVLALRAEGVYALVEQASAFGSAGTLVIVSFGLFTRIGGATTAAATLLAGVGSYLAASIGGLPHPFLTSLAAALGTYGGGAVLEAVARRAAVGVDQP